MRRLLLIPEPLEDESLAGYILRITDYNGYENSHWLYTMAGIQKKQIVRCTSEKINLEILSEITGIKSDKLWNMTFHNKIMDTSNAAFIKTSFKLGINLYSDKICPACFQERAYQKKIWNYVVNIVCPIHNLYLINECPRCKNRISPIRRTLKKCNCGFELSLLEHVAVEKDCIDFIQFFYDVYYQTKTINTQIDSLSNIKFVELLNIMITIWLRVGEYSKEKRPIVDFSILNSVEKNEILKVYEIFGDWPHSFYAFLESICIKGEGLSKAFGRFYKELGQKYNDHSFEFIHKEFINFINNNWHKPAKLGEKDLDNNVFVSGEQAMKILEIDRRTLNHLIEKGILESKTFGRDYVHTSIKSSTVSKYLIRKADYLNSTQVMELFKMESSVINLLDEQGYIRRIYDLDGLRTRKIYSHTSIKEFLFKVELYLEEIEEVTDNLTLFKKAINLIKFHQVELNYFFTAIFKGALKPKRTKGHTGLSSYMFLKNDIQKVIENYRKDNPEKAILSIKDAAKIIGLQQPVVSSWIKKGFLISHDDPEGRKFSIEDIYEFQEKYITLKEIAEKHNSISTYMLKQLRKNGIEPISGIDVDGSGGYLYKRSDVKMLLKTI